MASRKHPPASAELYIDRDKLLALQATAEVDLSDIPSNRLQNLFDLLDALQQSAEELRWGYSTTQKDRWLRSMIAGNVPNAQKRADIRRLCKGLESLFRKFRTCLDGGAPIKNSTAREKLQEVFEKLDPVSPAGLFYRRELMLTALALGISPPLQDGGHDLPQNGGYLLFEDLSVPGMATFLATLDSTIKSFGSALVIAPNIQTPSDFGAAQEYLIPMLRKLRPDLRAHTKDPDVLNSILDLSTDLMGVINHMSSFAEVTNTQFSDHPSLAYNGQHKFIGFRKDYLAERLWLAYHILSEPPQRPRPSDAAFEESGEPGRRIIEEAFEKLGLGTLDKTPMDTDEIIRALQRYRNAPMQVRGLMPQGSYRAQAVTDGLKEKTAGR